MSTSLPGPSGSDTPPFHLPGEHFAWALVFFLAGSVGLVAVAPELAAGAYLSPHVIATTHLFTLGWITTSIMGALYQFLPVALGRPIRGPRLARVTLWMFAPGLAVFVAGMMLARPAVLVGGAGLLGLALLLFVGNLAATLAGARRRDLTWWALAAADLFLFVTVVLGLALASNYRWTFMGANRLVALGTHLHVALVGWVLLVIVGVAHRLLPMFLLSHGANERSGKAAVALLSVGVVGLLALHHTTGPWRKWVPAAFILAGAAAFLVQARTFYRLRRKRALDAGMRLAAGALLVLALAAALSIAVLARGLASPRLATAYVLLAVLGISLFVAAHYYKIVPFLVWYHRFSSAIGRAEAPIIADLYSASWAKAAATLMFIGVLGLSGAVAGGWVPAVRLGAILICAGATIEAAQMFLVARRRPE